MSYEGIERRRMSPEDHDLLNRMDTKLDNLIEDFKTIKGKVNWHDRIIWVSIGGLTIVQVIMHMYK